VLEYEPALVEEAVLHVLRGHREERAFRRDRDRLYEIPDPEVIKYEGNSPSLTHPFGETGGLQRDVFLLVRTSLEQQPARDAARDDSANKAQRRGPNHDEDRG